MLIGELLAVSGAFSIGLGAILSRFLTFRINPAAIQVMRALSGGLIMVLIVAVVGDAPQYARLPLNIVGLSLLAAVCGITIGDAIYIKMLSLAPASKVCPVLWSLRIVLVSLGEAFFYHQPIKWTTGIAAVLIMVGVYLALSAEEAPLPQSAPRAGGVKKWLPLCLVTGVLWASYYLVMKFVLTEANAVIDNAPMIVNSLNSLVGATLLSLFLVAIGRGSSFKSYRAGGLRNFAILIANGILVYVIGMVMELYALDLAGAARTAILMSWAPIFVMLLSGVILKEKITWRLVIGTLLCIAGTIMLVTY